MSDQNKTQKKPAATEPKDLKDQEKPEEELKEEEAVEEVEEAAEEVEENIQDEVEQEDAEESGEGDKEKSLQDKPEVPDIQEVEVDDPNLIQVGEKDDPKAHWYVVHTYSGRENRVAETLKQRAQTLNLTDKIIKILIPTKEKIQIRKGQRKKIKEKVFPGYMLVNMIMDDDAWLAVRTTNGVTGFVGTSSRPSPIPTHEVEAIRNYSQQATPQYKAEYVEGQAVKITDGPFTDFLGTVQNINEERGEVEVLINIFGRETPVELDFLQVEKV